MYLYLFILFDSLVLMCIRMTIDTSIQLYMYVGLCLRQGCCNSGRSPDPHPDGAGGRGHQVPPLLRGDGKNCRCLGD